jgi:ubiquinone/menaquinone biosynthesis C-methylase UbiE
LSPESRFDLGTNLKVHFMQETDYFTPNHHKYTVQNRFYQWHLEEFFRSLYELLARTRPRTVLDAGCGEGYGISFLLRRNGGIRYTGLDVNGDAIAYARSHFGDHACFKTGSIYRLPFSDRSFDTVLCSEVLEHLEDPERAIGELKRVARRYVIVTVPREPYFDSITRLAQLVGIGGDPGHINFWTKRAFKDFMLQHFDDPVFDWKHVYQLALAEV